MPKSSVNVSSFLLTRTKHKARQTHQRMSVKRRNSPVANLHQIMADSGIEALGSSDRTS